MIDNHRIKGNIGYFRKVEVLSGLLNISKDKIRAQVLVIIRERQRREGDPC